MILNMALKKKPPTIKPVKTVDITVPCSKHRAIDCVWCLLDADVYHDGSDVATQANLRRRKAFDTGTSRFGN
jgi:hypothetical protein